MARPRRPVRYMLGRLGNSGSWLPSCWHRPGRLPGGGDVAAVHYPWEEKRLPQAKRQRVRLAKERLPHNRKDSTSRKDPEDGIVGLEGMARRGPRAGIL